MEKHGDAKDSTLEITIRSTRGARDFSFAKQTKVAAVIDKAVEVFGFAAGDRFELALATNLQETLQRDRPLVSYSIKDGDVLVLTSIGSGV